MTYHESIIVFNADTPIGQATVREMFDSQHRQNVSQQYGHVFATVHSIAHSGDLSATGACVIECQENPDERKMAECMKEWKIKTAVLVPQCGSKNLLQQAKKIISVCKQANVERFILISTLGAEDTSVEFGKMFHEIENHVKQAGISCSAIVRCAPPQQTLLLFRRMLHEHKLCLPLKEDVRINLVNLYDVSCFVVYELLHNRLQRGSEPQMFRLTGPAAHTIKDIIQCLERIIGSNIKFQHVNRQDFERYLKDVVMLPDPLVKEGADCMDLANRGRYNLVSDDQKKSTGKEPLKIEEWLNKHKDLFHFQ